MNYETIKYEVNGKQVEIKPQDKQYSKTTYYYEKCIYRALEKIGVTKEYVDIEKKGSYSTSKVKVSWEINGQTFSFECELYNSYVKNMSAVAQAIQDDVRHIRRGIKSLWASMRQYEALPKPEDVKSNNPYFDMDETEIKNLMKLYHPDGTRPDKKKFELLREAKELI